MNISSLLGFAIAGLVLYFGVIHGAKDPSIFLDPHALILVIGGTLAATLIAYPMRQLKDLGQFLAYGVILKRKINPLALIEDIRNSSKAMRTQGVGAGFHPGMHPFLAEGLNLLQKNYLSRVELEDVMHARRLVFKKKHLQDAKVLNAIAKYPPAFGLLGASTGMIAMMTNLGGPGGTSLIGASMAVALVATFWGIAAANFVLLPLADYAQRVIVVDQELRELIIEGVMMIHDGSEDEVLAERLRSRLQIEDRYKVLRRGAHLQSIPTVTASGQGHAGQRPVSSTDDTVITNTSNATSLPPRNGVPADLVKFKKPGT
ncbi:MAG: MotA/TolQ/ExbB proton channel family protein [Bdellovibrionaceae bacterium]|nr:MotA/TolQ/ExbB proton channel family protein [Pseudobdellovibrionaceae bacterium]